MGFSIFIFDQKPCSACGEKFLAFLVLKSIGAATINPCRWHSNWICQRRFPEIYLTFTRKPQHRCSCSFTRIWRFFQIHSVQWSSLIVGIYLKNGRSGSDNNHGAFDSNDIHPQPFSRFSSLLNFARIFLPVKHTFFLPLEDHVDVSCSGFMEAGSMRSLGLLPMANSIRVLPLKVSLCFSPLLL